MKTLLRPFKLMHGAIDWRPVRLCTCDGVAAWTGSRWTPGRRGPEGGVCGACNGAVLNDDERNRA